MYYFQLSGLTTHGRIVSHKTPNGHIFSHGYDKRNLSYINNNLLRKPPAQAHISKSSKINK